MPRFLARPLLPVFYPRCDHVDAIATHGFDGLTPVLAAYSGVGGFRPPATAIREFARSRRRTAARPPTTPAPIRNWQFESASRTFRISRRQAAPKRARVR